MQAVQALADMAQALLRVEGVDPLAMPRYLDLNLRVPLEKPSQQRSTPLLGIVLFSDGQHNAGAQPLDRAEELGRERVPVHAVVIGPRAPPSDLMVLDVQALTKVFKGATAPIEIRVKPPAKAGDR